MTERLPTAKELFEEKIQGYITRRQPPLPRMTIAQWRRVARTPEGEAYLARREQLEQEAYALVLSLCEDALTC